VSEKCRGGDAGIFWGFTIFDPPWHDMSAKKNGQKWVPFFTKSPSVRHC